jgi:hypothetical protein
MFKMGIGFNFGIMDFIIMDLVSIIPVAKKEEFVKFFNHSFSFT